MAHLKKYYQILGIEPTNDKNTIKRAYRKRAMEFHPDKNPSEDAQHQFIAITEAYEILMGLRQNAPTKVSTYKKTAQEARADKIKKAKARYKKMQESEVEKDALYFEKITTGIRWKIFKVLAYYCCVMSVLFTLDYFLTRSQRGTPSIEMYTLMPKALTHDGEVFEVLVEEYWQDDFPPIQLNYSFFFKDLKSIDIIDEPINLTNRNHPSDRRKAFELFENYESVTFYSYASVYYVFPFFQLALLLPIILVRLKRPTINFAIARLVAIWVVFPLVIYVSISNGRILHLLGIL